MTPAFTVIVVNFNSTDELRGCLKGLAAQSLENFEAIVIDNASADGAAFRAVAAAFDDPRFQFHCLPRNLGFAGGVNHAAKLARAPWIACLNPDAYAMPDWLEQASRVLEWAGPKTEMIASVQIDAGNAELFDGIGDCYAAFGLAWRGAHGHPRTAIRDGIGVFSPCGAAAFYRRDRFLEAGGFCERYFCYFEDIDLAFRLRLQGGACILANRALVEHVGGVSSGGAGSAFAIKMAMRNMPQTFIRCMPSELLWPLLPFHILMLAALLVRHACRGRGLAALSGLFAAARAVPQAIAERRSIQGARTAPVREIAREFNWNPVDAILRRPRRNVKTSSSKLQGASP